MNTREEQLTPAGGSTNIMHVYVVNQDKQPLMPCTPAKARKLLRAGKASVVERCPFTIQLCWQCEGQVLLAADIHHRRDVKGKMDDRRDRRKSRRARKWYRPKRFQNRATSRRSG